MEDARADRECKMERVVEGLARMLDVGPASDHAHNAWLQRAPPPATSAPAPAPPDPAEPHRMPWSNAAAPASSGAFSEAGHVSLADVRARAGGADWEHSASSYGRGVRQGKSVEGGGGGQGNVSPRTVTVSEYLQGETGGYGRSAARLVKHARTHARSHAHPTESRRGAIEKRGGG